MTKCPLESWRIIYGTAWMSKDDLNKNVPFAIKKGILTLDTAANSHHYNMKELSNLLKSKDIVTGVKIQSKYDHRGRLYKKIVRGFSPEKRIQYFIKKTLKYFNSTSIDCFFLHSPFLATSVCELDLISLNVLREAKEKKIVNKIGISNVSLKQLRDLSCEYLHEIDVIQNRFTHINDWDLELVDYCKTNNIEYQGYSPVRSNLNMCSWKSIQDLLKEYQCSFVDLVVKLCLELGVCPLIGPTQDAHFPMELNKINQLPSLRKKFYEKKY